MIFCSSATWAAVSTAIGHLDGCFWPFFCFAFSRGEGGQLVTAAALALLNYARHGGTSGPKALPAVHC